MFFLFSFFNLRQKFINAKTCLHCRSCVIWSDGPDKTCASIDWAAESTKMLAQRYNLARKHEPACVILTFLDEKYKISNFSIKRCLSNPIANTFLIFPIALYFNLEILNVKVIFKNIFILKLSLKITHFKPYFSLAVTSYLI